MKVSINYGEIKQGDKIYKVGEEMEIKDSKLSRFGDQVSPVVPIATPEPGKPVEPVAIDPVVEPVKEPEKEKSKGK